MSDNTQNPTQKAGKIMMILAWMTILGLLVAFFANWEEKSYNPNTDPNSQQTSSANTVVLQRNRYNHYVTAGKINQQEVTFLLDTGATDVVIPEKVANQLGLRKGNSQYATTANGVLEVFQTQLQELAIGSITLYNVNASINPSMRKGEGILLGMSALKDIEFTQRGEQLTLRQYR